MAKKVIAVLLVTAIVLVCGLSIRDVRETRDNVMAVEKVFVREDEDDCDYFAFDGMTETEMYAEHCFAIGDIYLFCW